MRRLLSLVVTALITVGLAVVGSAGSARGPVYADDIPDCETPPCAPKPPPPPPPPPDPDPVVGDQAGTSGGVSGKLVVPAEAEEYCNEKEAPGHPRFHRILRTEFLTADDRTIMTPDSGVPTDAPPPPIVVPKIAVAQKVSQYCSNTGGGTMKDQDFWVPLATPDSVALKAGLLVKVQRRLKMPEVVWLDIDKDHGWLWVNIDHHVSITPPTPVNESASGGNKVTGFATAWVKATPVSFTIELPRETGVKGTQLARCDLTQATSDRGCKIKFTHSSSITKDGWFSGRARITWAVSSNSGKYNGVGPFTTSSEVRVQVAEMMAVSRPVESTG